MMEIQKLVASELEKKFPINLYSKLDKRWKQATEEEKKY